MSTNNSAFDVKRLVKENVSLNSPAFYLGLMTIIIVASFLGPFWWMPSQWFQAASFSPGPMAPILFGFILFFKLKRSKKAFKITKELKVFGGIVGGLAAIFYFGYEVIKDVPLMLVGARIAFLLLFLVVTGVLFYTAWVVKNEVLSKDLPTAPRLTAVMGWFFVVVSLAVHFLAIRGDLPRLSIMAYLGLMIGLVMVIFGFKTAFHILFPVLFLLFMVPWSFIDDYLGGPLRIIATTSAVGIMNAFGMGVEQTGTTMSIDGMQFSVEAACSGLKSLMALSALGATFAFTTQPTVFRKYFVAVCAFPIAIAANVFRLIGVAVFAKIFDQKIAMTVFHDNAAIFLYIVAILLLFSVDKLFKVQWLKIEDW
jgi:exosortase